MDHMKFAAGGRKSSSSKLFAGWGGWDRTSVMTESKSVALPLGDTPIQGIEIMGMLIYIYKKYI